MEGLGAAANIIAVVDISAKVAALCLRYSKEVAGARTDIDRLHSHVKQLNTILQAAKRLADGPSADSLDMSRELIKSFHECAAELQKLEDKLAPSGTRQAMRRFGLRALKWPFTSKEVNQAVENLDRYRRVISLGLQIDQAALLIDIQENLKNLKLHHDEDVATARKPHFVVPFPPDPHFVRRPTIWTWITDQFESSDHQRIALVGMGGFGKSQLAIQFAHEMHAQSPDTSVFWVHGRSRATFEESYRALADALLLPRRHDPDVNILALVRDWLQGEDSASSWLMIVDNADDPSTFFPESSTDDTSRAVYLPVTKGKILFTSRSLDAAERLAGSSTRAAILRIPAMDDEQALQLLRNKLNDVEKDAALDLAQTLDRIPLALNQAAAYINRRGPRVTIRSYVDEFRGSEKRKDSLLRSDKGDLRRHPDVSNSVAVTWQITFEQIRRDHPRASNLLSLMSCFQPQNIPERMLHGYDDDTEARDDQGEDFEDDMDVLQGYSLVTFADMGICEMHSLVQFCTRAWISEFGDQKRWQSLFTRLAAEHFPPGRLDTWEECQRLLPHVQSVVYSEPAEEADQLGRATLVTNMSQYTMAVGDYGGASVLAGDAVEVRKTILGEEHPATLASMHKLVSALRLQSRYKEGEVLAMRVLEAHEAEGCTADDRSRLVSMRNLAQIYHCQGRYGEAVETYTRLMETFATKFGVDDDDVSAALSYLGFTLGGQGRWEEVEPLQLQVLEASKRKLGPDHPTVLINTHNMAVTYMRQTRWKEAEALQTQVLEAFKQKLGVDHHTTLTVMRNLAGTYRRLGRPEDARALLEQVLKASQARPADDGLDTAYSRSNLAGLYCDDGRWEDAEKLIVQSLEEFRAKLGADHPQTLRSMSNLALVLRRIVGRQEEAVALQEYVQLRQGGAGILGNSLINLH